jgi:hypothetical protein
VAAQYYDSVATRFPKHQKRNLRDRTVLVRRDAILSREERPTRRREFFLGGLCLGAISGCTPVQQAPNPVADVRFRNEPPLVLRARHIEIHTAYAPTDADLLFPVPPVRAVQNWARDRLRADGEGGFARFTISDAHATIQDLPLQAYTSADQFAERYDAHIEAALDFLDERGQLVRGVTIRGAAANAVRESAPAGYREQTRFLLVRDLMSDFDRRAEDQIRLSLAEFVASPPSGAPVPVTAMRPTP